MKWLEITLLAFSLQAPPQVDPYETLLLRVQAGEKVLVASGIPNPPGFEFIQIPGEQGLFECWKENNKAMMRKVTIPVVHRSIPVNCFT